MNTLNRIILGMTMFLFLAMSLQAQETVTDENQVVLMLKNGTKLEGKIVEWVQKEHIKIVTSWGSELKFQEQEIKKIVQKTAMNFDKPLYNFKDQGVYASFKGMFITGNDGPRAKAVNGFGISASAGYRISRLLGVGFGVGFDQFIWNSGEEMIPVFLELSGFLFPNNTSAFYNIQTGYSFALQDETFLITDANGGWMIYPSIGIRFGSGPQKFTLDFGYKFQNAKYWYQDRWTASTVSEQELTYKRLTLRFGVMI